MTKFTLPVFASLLGLAAARTAPQLSLSVRNGNFEGLDGLDPLVMWESSTQAGDIDVAYGASASVYPTRDLASLPKALWAKASTKLSGWGLSARAETKGLDFLDANVEVDADNENADLNLHLVASAGNNNRVRSVEATKGMNIRGAHVAVTPRFNFENDSRDVVVDYNLGKTDVKVVASRDNQELTLWRQVNDNNRVAPTVFSNGDVSLAWERRLAGDSSVTTTLKPNDNLNVEWKDNDWTANIRMPMAGANINGADVSIKRDVRF
ncbi:hypothetical protein ACA910_006951 [Epithemia clementina (nom. ined.)]